MLLLMSVLAAAYTADASHLTSSSAATTPVVRLFIGYCPTDFSGAGAIVDMDPLTGTWVVTHPRVDLPSSEVFGCVADYDPTFDFSQANPDQLWFDFVSDDAAFLQVNMAAGNVTKLVSPDEFFTGFIDFKVFPDDSGALQGITGTVTQSGYCSDGCLGYGIQNTSLASHRRYRQISTIPFKAGADDTSFVDWDAHTLAFQGSYDLRPTTCGPQSSSQCLVTIDTVDGSLLSAVYTPDYQVFKFDRSYLQPAAAKSAEQRMTPAAAAATSKEVLTFAAGNRCGNGEGSGNNWTYQFLSIDMASANASVVSCVDPSLVLDEDQWVGGFSPSRELFATGSGNGNGDDPQVVVLNVTSGAMVVNTQLTGLAAALKAKMGLVFIWGLQVVAPS
jgi:hypothetical protein